MSIIASQINQITTDIHKALLEDRKHEHFKELVDGASTELSHHLDGDALHTLTSLYKVVKSENQPKSPNGIQNTELLKKRFSELLKETDTYFPSQALIFKMANNLLNRQDEKGR